MTIHIFRLLPRDGYIHDTSLALENKYKMYAFTENKKLAKRFMKERNMKLFLHTTVKKDKETAEYWMHHNRGRWLAIRDLETYLNKNTPQQITKNAKVLITEDEKSFVEETIDTNPIGPINEYCGGFVDPDVFEDDLQASLKRLRYHDLWRMALYAKDYVDAGAFPNGPIDTPDIAFDSMGMFTLMYGDLLTTKFYEDLKIMDKE